MKGLQLYGDSYKTYFGDYFVVYTKIKLHRILVTNIVLYTKFTSKISIKIRKYLRKLFKRPSLKSFIKTVYSQFFQHSIPVCNTKVGLTSMWHLVFYSIIHFGIESEYLMK